ncbi:F-actin-monooxygenase MICAL3 [Euwallacea similis]|uniref:F-actin-monooxygenase MICAL3 n=1 Tax=Euwallacea similis TaxID=1736056 RepID=UPI003450CD3E
MDRHSGGGLPPHLRGRPVSGSEAAHANEYFEHFLNATTLKNILGYHRSMSELLHLKPNVFPQFYPKLRANLTSWKAKALWKKFDARISHKCYGKGKACAGTRVLVIGAGPCGLRTAIEAQLLGAKVVVVEKRDRLSRNNVLHLWPFVIEDLRMLGAKKFFGKFCAGAIDHISIRQLQCILLKVALLLGVEIHTEVSFEGLIEPSATDKVGWRAEIKPENHPMGQYEFDAIIGADGKRNTLQGFKRKEFRGKLAIAITANFINKKTEAEASVEEISGVAFIFNQKFFKDLQAETRIDLENIVYYKDDTHYFVMTAKKASLLEKGVIKQDLSDTEKLLAPENVDREALQNYARQAADFSTNYQLPELDFAVNHYGQPDVAMFDFTSMYAAEYASKVVERNGCRLLMILVGDSLLEPFWPTGSGCARGFLSSLDAAWAIRSYCSGQMTPLDVLAERESIYRLLAQTTPDNLNKDWKAYTLDPATRYPNLNKSVVTSHQTVCLYDADNSESIEKMKRASLEAMSRQEHMPKKRRRGNVDNEVLLNWVIEQLRGHEEIAITDLNSVFRNGKALCAIIHHYRPDLLDYSAIKDNEPAKCNQLAMDILEKDLGLPPFMTGEEITKTEDFLAMTTYLTQVYDTFRGEIPHIKHPKLELPESNKRGEFLLKSIKISNHQPSLIPSNNQPSRPSSRHKRHNDIMVPKPCSIDRKQRKRRTMERVGPSVEERQKTLAEIASNRQDRQQKRKQQRQRQTDQFLKSMQMLHANCKPDSSEPFEDYSIFLYRQTAPKFQDRVKDLEKQFTYVPDHDSKIPGLKPQANTNAEEDIASKIKSLEDKWSNKQQAEKKPKDLMRAIGKIETSDWNIKQIEKKILENKMGKPSTLNADKERVPRWSREEFKARQTKMERKHLETEDGSDAKYADIDRNIKQLDLKLKEGTNRELGQNKVASITERLASKAPQEKEKPVEKPIQLKPVNLPMQSGSEFCHFCGKRVYLMERLSAEGRFFHHGCFKCQYCHSQLRLGSYMFDRDGQYGYRFFCIHHYGMQGELPRPSKLARKASQKGLREAGRSPQKKVLSGVAGVDLLDRVQTPERIEFSNLSAGNISSDHEEALSQMDEDEWTDKNFGASANELDDSDDSSSSLSDTDSDDEDAFDDALEQPITKEGTMKWAERLKNSYRKGRHSGSDGYSSSDHSSYYENSSDESDSDTATEGEDEIRARELRKQEVRVEPPVVQTDTGTDTEMVSGESSSDSSSEIHNSATEISTDSEFAQDDPTPTRELPSIALGDIFVTKSRGSRKSHYPKRLQVTAGYIEQPRNGRKTEKTNPNIELKLSPLVPSTPTFRKPAPLLARTEGYALNRTQSTGGIAAKVSLELKKKYLLGESGTNSIQKSGSASTLDTKFKSFQNTISDCQKLLKPALEVSPGMQVFCNKLDERHSPVSPQGGFVLSGKTVESKLELPPPDITITTINENKEEGSESRPRSPAHEASIAVPSIDWSKQNDSQSSDSLSLSESASEKAPSFDIPRVEVHSAKESSDKEEMALDSLAPMNTPSGEQTKSITTEKKSLNQPKSLPNLESVLPEIHKALHVKLHKEDSPEDNKTISGKSSPEATTVLTETELSDWAREENASDSIELDLSSEKRKTIKIAQLSEFEEAINHHICGKSSKEMANKTILTEAMNSTLSGNLDHIEYMDTGTETSSEDGVADSQNGYVLFKNEEEDSLNLISESKAKKELALNTGYCEVVKDSFGGEIIDLKPADLERLKQKQALTDHEEDSLIIMETGTTTEENTCSDSTVKNITEIKPSAKLENLQKQRLEEKLAKVKAEQALIKDQKENIENNLQYEEHCQRLQSKVEFGNARDSIDIRKSRRKSKSDSPQKPDLIQEEKERQSPAKEITLNLSPVVRPDVIYKKEDIKKERDVNKKLIEEMVMNKMKAENKSLERKKRNRSNIGNLSPSRPYNLQKSSSSLEKNSPNSSSNYATPDLLSNSVQLSSNDKFSTPMTGYTPKQNSNRPLSVFSTLTDVRKLPATPLTNPENFSMPDIRKNLFGDAPKAPPRYNRPSDVSKTAEKMKETARARARLLSNEDLGLSPEDKINKLREKVGKKPNLHIQESIESLVLNTERRNSLLYSNDTLTKKRNNSFRRAKSGDSDGSLKISENNNLSLRPKSISEIPKNLSVTKSKEMECEKQICKSDPNLLDTSEKPKKKSKDRERRKSITKLIAGIFTKKSPSSAGGKGLFAKLSPKSKAMSKSFTSLDLCKHEAVIEEPKPRKCTSELDVKRREVTPPPIPPLPLNYTLKATDESSDGEMPDGKFQDRSSCDTLDQSMGNTDMPTSGKKSGKSRRLSRQAQLKRHRMAQEIQRKLEETEVKTRELEQRGVEVEKALRGEDGEQGVRDESELLQEWFDLMRDRSELRRYEKELMVRAQELELEDRHSRLQLELRERLDNSEKKTEEDLSIEQSIISEMMDIVAKRDTLIAVLEEDRLRYSHEDKDLEEQMLAKGLMLTPIQKATEK